MLLAFVVGALAVLRHGATFGVERGNFAALQAIEFIRLLESGVPTGIRTPVCAVRGRRPRPLDDGDTGAAA